MTAADYQTIGRAWMALHQTYRLSDCPYADGWRRTAWQAGAWAWMREQKKST